MFWPEEWACKCGGQVEGGRCRSCGRVWLTTCSHCGNSWAFETDEDERQIRCSSCGNTVSFVLKVQGDARGQ